MGLSVDNLNRKILLRLWIPKWNKTIYLKISSSLTKSGHIHICNIMSLRLWRRQLRSSFQKPRGRSCPQLWRKENIVRHFLSFIVSFLTFSNPHSWVQHLSHKKNQRSEIQFRFWNLNESAKFCLRFALHVKAKY